jgi:hypothetical protein
MKNCIQLIATLDTKREEAFFEEMHRISRGSRDNDGCWHTVSDLRRSGNFAGRSC